LSSVTQQADISIPVASVGASTALLDVIPSLSSGASDASVAVPVEALRANAAQQGVIPKLPIYAAGNAGSAVPDGSGLTGDARKSIVVGGRWTGGETVTVVVDAIAHTLPTGTPNQEEVVVGEVEEGGRCGEGEIALVDCS
jgi:hypothetical protein